MTPPKRAIRLSRPVLAVTAVALSTVAISSTPAAAAVSRSGIVSTATSELNNSSRNHESPAGSGCNYYTGYFRSWKPADGCPSTDGVQWRDSDWCADFVKYVWSKSGVTHAGIPEGDGGLSGWAYSLRDYGQKYGTWRTRGSGYTPQPGDAITFDWDNDGDINHVGIVTSATSTTVHTIEGNSGNRTQRNSYSRDDVEIEGYSAPVGATSGSSYGGDFDGNGVGDLFATAGGELHLWNGQGGNEFGTRVVVGSGWSAYGKPISGDFNADGKSDLAAVKDGSTLFIWNGQSGNEFGSDQRVGAGWGAYGNTLTSVGDVNGDGRDDIAAITDNTLFIWNGQGSNEFGPAQRIGGGWGPYGEPVGGDFNADGKGDLAAISDNTLFIWNGQGSNAFGPAQRVGGGWGPYGNTLMSLGDVNRDGKGDIAAITDNTLFIWNGQSANAFGPAQRIGGGWGPYV
ncbi:FG-GAP-like repeat-containing protein [Nonomuraea sp. NPDC050643]|uniref:FG-GAP-like repeat-containing protein n=1 Tax=Nonomuraea sp. NPDC050643 TaxID=3155660 RepID=UPI0033C37D29